eukprot:35068_1
MLSFKSRPCCLHLFHVFIILRLFTCVTSIFEEDHEIEQCIQNRDQLFCISLLTLSFDGISTFYLTMTDDPTDVQYQSGHLTLSTIRSATACFNFDSTKSVHIQTFNALTNAPIGSTQSIPIGANLSTITLTEPIGALTASFALWLSKYQCLEVVSGNMFIEDMFTIDVDLYRMNAFESANRVSSSTNNLHLSKGNTASWNTMICLPGSPVTSNFHQVAADITITSYWTQYEYNPLYINHNQTSSTRFVSVPYNEYQGAHTMLISVHFAIGEIAFKYWQSCELSCNDKFGPCWDEQQHKILQQQFPLYIILLLFGITLIIILLGLISYFKTKNTYKLSSGEVDYKALLWLMIELWDWWTDLAFVLFLYLNVTLITEERVPGLILLFVLAICSLLLTFIINMVYLVHYLQMWSERHAPGITRLWLQEWSWFLIAMSMTFGGVHVALEFCNLLIVPNLNIFTMHVPHSEMVRTRKDRFITNLLPQNIPFMCIYAVYILRMQQLESEHTQSHITAEVGFVTTVFSVLLSIMWAVYRRGYAQQHPLALYSVHVHFKTERWKQYYIHCHNRICRAVQNGLNVRKMNLIILDQCSESFESMKIEARILKDTKVFGYELPPVSSATAQRILNCLISEFRKEQNSLEGPGNMELKSFNAQHVNYGEGEYVYSHNTGVLVLCNGIKSCFCPQKQPKGTKSPKESKMEQRPQQAIQMADWNENDPAQVPMANTLGFNGGVYGQRNKLYPAQVPMANNLGFNGQMNYAYQNVKSASIASQSPLNPPQERDMFPYTTSPRYQ